MVTRLLIFKCSVLANAVLKDFLAMLKQLPRSSDNPGQRSFDSDYKASQQASARAPHYAWHLQWRHAVRVFAYQANLSQAIVLCQLLPNGRVVRHGH